VEEEEDMKLVVVLVVIENLQVQLLVLIQYLL
jgi:hypothetical protein